MSKNPRPSRDESAVGLIEFKSIARGMIATDAMLKKVPITILKSQPISSGKFITLICGEIAHVEESMKAGIEKGGDLVVNHFFLPKIHPSIIPAIQGVLSSAPVLSVGILETFSVASCVMAADFAMKASSVELLKIRLGEGIGGKAFFVISGELSSVEVSLERAAAHVRGEGLLTAVELIQNPHSDLITNILG